MIARIDHYEEPPKERTTCFSIDWLEYRGLIDWPGYDFNNWLTKLEHHKLECRAEHSESLPIRIGDIVCLMRANGMGTGRQSRFEYVFEVGPVFFAVSGRDADDLKHANLYVKMTGDTCLEVGIEKAQEIIDHIVSSLGGSIGKTGVTRLDICLDVANLGVNDGLQQAVERGQWYGSLVSHKSNVRFHGDPRTGFSLGTKSGVQLKVYDKITEGSRKGGEYLERLKKNRWGGIFPREATRIEYSIPRDFMRKHGLAEVTDVLANVSELTHKVTSTTDYPLLVVTSDVPDRKNKNHKRCTVYPQWQWIIDEFRMKAGEPQGSLQKVSTGELSLKRGYAFIRGYLTSSAAKLGMPCEHLDDAVEVLKMLETSVEPASDEWSRRWKPKAIKQGTYQDLTSFNFGANEIPNEAVNHEDKEE